MKSIIVVLTICLATNAFGQKYKPGYYYTAWGAKINGFLLFSDSRNSDDDNAYKEKYGICSFHFKYVNEKKAKEERFTTRDVASFVIDGDSFAILKNIQYTPRYRSRIVAQDYVKVIETGKLNLYQYYTEGTSSTYMAGGPGGGSFVGGFPDGVDWYLERDGKSERLSASQFSTQFGKYFYDYPELFQKIKKGELDYSTRKDDVVKMVKLYNAHFRSAPKPTE